MIEDEKIIDGSGNVFADLGLPDADELHYKTILLIQIVRLIRELGLSQMEAARILGVPQPKVSDLLRGKLEGYSTDRLFKFLLLLGQDIEITLKPTPRKRRQQVKIRTKAASSPNGTRKRAAG